MNIEKWLKKNTTSLKGKTIAITGSSGDIGKQTCYILASLGANLIFLNRNENKSRELKEELLDLNNDIFVDYINVDFENFKSVKNALVELDKYDLDILIVNAGAYKVDRRISDIGYDNVFQINFISPYFLIKKTMEKMRLKHSGKVVVVSSIAHNYSCLNELDIDYKKEKKQSKVYGNSKRFLTFSLYELFKNEKEIELSIVHPGITLTNMTGHFPKPIYWMMKYPMKWIFISNKKAALNIILGVFKSCNYKYWIGPKIFNVWGYPKYKLLNTVSKDESESIYKISEKIYIENKDINL